MQLPLAAQVGFEDWNGEESAWLQIMSVPKLMELKTKVEAAIAEQIKARRSPALCAAWLRIRLGA
jgi:hypothetical protein